MVVYLIFGAFIAAAVAGMIYILTRFRKFGVVKRLSGGRKGLSWLLAAIPVAAMGVWCFLNPIMAVIAVIHLLVFWLLSELLGWIVHRITKRKQGKVYWQGLLALAVTAVYLSIGWYLAHHVVETDYTLTTAKDLGMDRLRVVQISDSHVGATFDGDGYAKHMETIQKVNPDLVVITGDYVDDDTTREDMIKCCEAMGKMQSTYGVFFVYGNHDRGYFNNRDFTYQNLEEELTKNNVTVLKDETVQITEQIYLIGRRDRSMPERDSMEELTGDLDKSRYMIVLDHQPHDFAAQEAAGVDLVLCGHTHGGQMWPVGLLGEWSGANEKTYGLETRGTTNYIVNSGISDWAIPFKTGCIAEFGVIDIVRE